MISVNNKQFSLYKENTFSDFTGDILPRTSSNFIALFNIGDIDLSKAKNINVSVGSAYLEKSDGYVYPKTDSFYFSINLSENIFEPSPNLLSFNHIFINSNLAPLEELTTKIINKLKILLVLIKQIFSPYGLLLLDWDL